MITLLNGKVQVSISVSDSIVPKTQIQKELKAIENALNRTGIEYEQIELRLILPGTVDICKMDEFFSGTYYKLINSKGIGLGEAYILENYIAGAVNESRGPQVSERF